MVTAKWRTWRRSLETLFMVASVIWILAEALERILGHAPPLNLSIWPFAVLLLSMAVDFVRSRALAASPDKQKVRRLKLTRST